MIRSLRAAASLAALCAGLLAAPGAIAQAFPDRPVTLIVPFPAGGPSDALARAVAQKMAAPLGQPIVIENLGGANGVIGLTKATKAAGGSTPITTFVHPGDAVSVSYREADGKMMASEVRVRVPSR